MEAEGEDEEEPEAEAEATGPSDSCLTLDEEESSCDTVGPQTNGHAASTEEESSNETPAVATAALMDEVASESRDADEDAAEDDEKPITSYADDGPDAVDTEDRDNHSDLSGPSPPPGHTGEGPVEAARADCVNGNESMDSVDLGSLETGHGEDMRQHPPEVNEHKEKHLCEPSLERHLQDGGAAVMEIIPDQGEGEVSSFFFFFFKSKCRRQAARFWFSAIPIDARTLLLALIPLISLTSHLIPAEKQFSVLTKNTHSASHILNHYHQLLFFISDFHPAQLIGAEQREAVIKMTCTIKIRERPSPCCHCNGLKLQRDVIIICHIILSPCVALM